MRIGIDVHMLGEQQTGVATYVRELVFELYRRLSQDPDFTLEIFGKPEHVQVLEQLFPPHERMRISYVPGTRFWTSLQLPRWFFAHRRELRSRLDIILFPAHTVPAFCPVPPFVTIHDTAFISYPDHFTAKDRRRLRYITRTGVKRAARVLAVSQTTANDVIQIYHVPAKKVVVTLNAADTDHFRRASVKQIREAREHYGLPEEYIITVGTLQRRKNYERLIEAFHRLHLENRERHLVIIGGKGWLYEDIFATAKRLQTEAYVHFVDHIPYSELPLFYSGALLSVQVGLYEGFGIPILESFACGTPAVVANTGAAPEIAGDAAITVDPLNVEAIASAIDNLACDPALRARLENRMEERLKDFSWKLTADKTLAAAQEFLGGQHG